jgi:type I restriction enzyme S subunit
MAEHYRPTGVTFLRSLNIKPFRLNYEDLRFIDEGFHNKIRKSALRPGDVAVVRTGYPGTACVIPESLPDSNCSDLVIVRPSVLLNPHYLAAIFNSQFGKDLVGGNLVGAAQQHFNVTVAKELQLLIPPRGEQDKIAAILSAYDDLIANNQRRITLLERMAEDIYREWFVRLRFPGHEDVKLDCGLPQGWRVAELGEIFKTSSGGTPARDDPSNFGGDISWIKTGELKSTFAIGSEESITQRGIENSPAKVYPKHTVVMAMYCAMPDLSITANDAATNQACCAFLPKNSSFHHSYCYFLVKFAQLQLVMFAHGAAQQNLSQEIIKKFPVVLPLEPLILAFGEKAAPIFDSIETLMRVNKELASTRDALLPRLISGKLSVDALDIRFPPGMVDADA